MVITSSYKVEIVGAKAIFALTARIYRDALAYCIDVFNGEWETLAEIEGVKSRFNFAEHLLHSTRDNAAKYDFDLRFPKMPSYLRRAVIQAALGAVSSYRSNLANWESGSRIGKAPRLQCDRLSMPTFYNKEMYSASEDPNAAYLKLYHNNDWVWVKVRFRSTDMRYIQKYWANTKASAPTLEKRYGRYYLRFAFSEKVQLSDTPVPEQRICAWGTSRLAFDGSGTLVRDDDNRAWATFQTGKRYNCDLNASYNIGARYFIREILKPLPETARSRLLAEVPAAGRRTSCTLDTLLRVHAALAA